MRVVIQRAGHASVTINGTCKASIGKGLMILVGIEESDGKEDIDWLCKKIVNLRIFDDENGVMNKSILEYWLSASSPSTPPPRKATVPPTYGQHGRKYPSRCTNNSAGN